MSTTMRYGDYYFSPVPMITIDKAFNKTADGTVIGTTFDMALNGTLTPLPTGTGGITNTIQYMDNLRNAFTQEGCPFVIDCGGTTLWSGNPRVGNIHFEDGRATNQWVQTIDFTVGLQFDIEGGEGGSEPFIEEASENWSLTPTDQTSRWATLLPSFNVDYGPSTFVMTHEVFAKGKRHYTACDTVDKEPWEYARDYVSGLLGFNSYYLANVGIMNFDVNNFNQYNHARFVNNDVLGGTYGVRETWLIMETGTAFYGTAIEDFTIESVKSISNPLTMITINGNIQGVETVDYGSNSGDYSVDTTKYSAATSYWNSVKGHLYDRANHAYGLATGTLTLNTQPLSNSLSHSFSRGNIGYNYTYNDRPSNCVTGLLVENIEIIDNNYTDVFAQIAVLGRALGPVLQDISTITQPTKEINIAGTCLPVIGCTAALLGTPPNNVRTDVQTLLCSFQTELTGTYSQVFKNADNESWNPKTGQYNRKVSFVYQDCDVTGITSLC